MVFATVAVAVAFTTGAFGFSEQLSRLLAPSDSVQAATTLPEGTVVVTAETSGLATATALDDQLLDRSRAGDGVALNWDYKPGDKAEIEAIYKRLKAVL